MAYCTAQDVIDAYSREQIAEVTGDAQGQAVDRGQVERAVEDYGAQVEAHVRMQHPDDPFDVTNEYLNSLNVEGAFLLLQKRTTGGMEENLQDAEERLDGVLLRIAQGELELLDDEDEAEAEGRPDLRASELTRARPRVFGRWSRQRYDEL
jgi:phage gp36-like protein